jgi:hypothetical protein
MSCTTYGSAQGDELLKKSGKWFMCSTIFLLYFLLCHLTIETWLLDKISHRSLIAEQTIHIFVLAQRRFLHNGSASRGAACRHAELPSLPWQAYTSTMNKQYICTTEAYLPYEDGAMVIVLYRWRWSMCGPRSMQGNVEFRLGGERRG